MSPLFYTKLYATDDKGGDQVDPNELSYEELQKASVDEDDKIVITPDKKEEPQDKQPEPEKDEKVEEPKKEEPKEEPKKEPEKEKTDSEKLEDLEKIPKDQRTNEQVLELRRLHAERKMHEVAQEKSKLERELEQQRKKLYEYEKEKAPKFERLDEEEQNELREEDPEAYVNYKKEEVAYNESLAQKAKATAEATFNNIAAFYQSITNKAGEKAENIIESQEFREWLKSDEFKNIDRYVTDFMNRQYDGTYSVKQMMDAHFVVNRDKIIADARVQGRKEAVDDITKATASDASKLDKIPKESGTKTMKKASELTSDEIDQMGKEELESYEKELKLEGMA